LFLASILATWRSAFDEVINAFGGWPSLDSNGLASGGNMSIERLFGLMVARFRADSLFKATVQPDDKNSRKHVLLVSESLKKPIRTEYFANLIFEQDNPKL
jgi:hypothetical protein